MLSRPVSTTCRSDSPTAIEPDSEARLMTATCDGITVVNVYVPNGRVVGSDHYEYKLSWLERLGAHVDAVTGRGDAVIVAGDFNIAPTDADVYDPAAFEGETHVTAAERERLGALARPRTHRRVPPPAPRRGEGLLMVGLPPR